MQTLIIGAGAMGNLFAARLTAAGQAVALFDINEEKVALIRREGLFITEMDGNVSHWQPMVYAHIEDCPKADLCLVMVKTYQTERVLEDLARVLHPGLSVLSLQNGLSGAEILSRLVPEEQLLAGVTYQGALVLSPNQVQHTGNGSIHLGSLSLTGLARAEVAARLFRRAGFDAKAEADVSALRWQKLLVNAAINPLTAISGVENGALLDHGPLQTKKEVVLAEGLAVAAACGVQLDGMAVRKQTMDTCRATAKNHSSMLSDVENGRMTEIDAINGVIVRLGEEHGVDVPVNRDLLEAMKRLHPAVEN